MASLIFRVLDQHVVGGLADHPAISDERGEMSYAQLLHESACLAGAMVRLGASGAVAIELPPGREQVIAVLAAARLGVVPAGTAEFRFAGDPAVLFTPDTEVPWDVLIRVGRTEPVSAPDQDPDGYEPLMLGTYESIFATLASGATII